MVNQTFKHRYLLSAAFVLFSVAVFGVAFSASAQNKSNDRQQEAPAAPAQQRRQENKKPPDTTRYSYEFTQPEFYVRHIVINHDANGRGKIIFERKGEEASIEEPIELSMGALGRVLGAWTELRFLESTDNYQSERQYAHLGTMRLKMERDLKNRTAEFNYTHNKIAASLIDEYRRIGDQAILIFDISVARETQPLNAPKLMDEVESQLKRHGLSDPQQLVPLLTDISTDEHLPLIARNHALRLIKKLEN